MKLVFDLAKNGSGYVEPNPLVGAAVIKNGMILAVGYHRYFGGPHAEIEVINKIPSSKLKNSTLFVNLEPCCHYDKKTPPCLDKILASKFKEICISNIDPNPKVNGKAIKILRDKGYKVKTKILEEEGKFLNRAFYKSIREKIPYVVLKAAITCDNKLGIMNKKVKISSSDAIFYAKQARDEFNGVLIGAKTLTTDDPVLLPFSKKIDIPKIFYRIIISTKSEKILFNKKVVITSCESNPIIFARIGANFEVLKSGMENREEKYLNNGATTVKTIKAKNLSMLLKVLYCNYNIGKLLVEGGSATFRSFYYTNYFDEIHLYVSNKILPDKNAIYLTEKNQCYYEFTKGMKLYETKKFINTKLLKYYKQK